MFPQRDAELSSIYYEGKNESKTQNEMSRDRIYLSFLTIFKKLPIPGLPWWRSG